MKKNQQVEGGEQVKVNITTTAPQEGATEDRPHVADEIPEIEIIAKIRAGLTREQAIEVINSQRAHDKAQAEG
jgi:hypothetical protein